MRVRVRANPKPNDQVSLKRLLAEGRDVTQEAFPLYGGEGEAVAEVVLSLRAVETMRQLLSGRSKAQQEEDRKGGGAAGAKAKAPAADERLDASATSASNPHWTGFWP